MKKEATSDFYDNAFAKIRDYDLDWYKCGMKDVYTEALSLLNGNEKIFEIGCGTGQFIQALYMENKCSSYSGFDFSDVAIHKARIRNKFNTTAWIFKGDVYGVVDHINLFIKDSDTIIALEVFEHIRDIEVLKKLSDYRKGLKIICSLPTFDSKSHLRFFNNDKEIIDYYKNIIEIVAIKKIDRWYLFVGEIL